MKHDKGFRTVIVIAGNHDYGIDPLYNKNLKITKYNHPLLTNCDYYLCDDLLEFKINGGIIKIYGSPYTHSKMAFACIDRKKRMERWSQIPSHIDILMTHTPALNIMDLAFDTRQISNNSCTLCHRKHNHKSHWGCEILRNEVIHRIRPRVHCFGHVHDHFGKRYWQYEDGSITTFLNGASKWNPMRKPFFFDFYVQRDTKNNFYEKNTSKNKNSGKNRCKTQ
jgi:hypothetical protein